MRSDNKEVGKAGAKRRRGSLILSEGRSGSNWLGSLTTGTGQLGNSNELFARWSVAKEMPNAPMDSYIEAVLDRASTPNGYFCVKLFPSHVHYFNIRFGADLIQILADRHDCNFVSLYRNDRLRQAISYARGLQTEQWTSRNKTKKKEHYDADLIARCFFLINRSYDFWDTYIQIRDLPVTQLHYEDMLETPQPYVDCIAKHAGITLGELPESPLKIQRDEITEDWINRFQADLPSLNLVENSTAHRPYHDKPSNLLRFLGRKPMKPYPFTF